MITLCDGGWDRGGVGGLLQLLLALHPQQLHPRVRLLHLVHLRELRRVEIKGREGKEGEKKYH